MTPACNHATPGDVGAGERYDGEWLEGQESGVGVFTWQDGSTYEGFWLNGRKEGVGVFRPAPHTQGMPGSDPSVRPLGERQPAGVADGASPPHSPVGQAVMADGPLDSPAASGRAVRQLASLTQGERAGCACWGSAAACRCCDGSSKRVLHVQVAMLGGRAHAGHKFTRQTPHPALPSCRGPAQHWCRRRLGGRRPGVCLPVSAAVAGCKVLHRVTCSQSNRAGFSIAACAARLHALQHNPSWKCAATGCLPPACPTPPGTRRGGWCTRRC